MVREMKINGRDAGDGVHAQSFGMGGKLAAFVGVVAGHMRNDGTFALHLGHDGFEDGHALFFLQIDAFARGAAHVQPLDALVDQMPRQPARALHAHLSRFVIAGIEGGNDAAVSFNVHGLLPPSLVGISPLPRPW